MTNYGTCGNHAGNFKLQIIITYYSNTVVCYQSCMDCTAQSSTTKMLACVTYNVLILHPSIKIAIFDIFKIKMF